MPFYCKYEDEEEGKTKNKRVFRRKFCKFGRPSKVLININI